MLNTFVRLTILLAICILAVKLFLLAVPILIIAAVIAALVIGVLFVLNFIRRIGERPSLPTRR
ncbi:MAG: hypothetical protein JO024_02550 [Candidatus Eremiobacteraeota bacterium]|nr:hypothetical protein [Candidatus Eremiobacteraeota bacterium]MBV9737510.1 hypothetical protein [Candidatus Eremiobacteraeota bacterium]